MPLRKRKQIQTLLRSATAGAKVDGKSKRRYYCCLLPTSLGARNFARCGGSDETSFAPINADYTPVGYRSGSRSASARKRERIVLVYLRALSDGLVRDQDFCGMNGQVWDEPPK